MKRKRIPIPQYEFGFTAETYRLVQEHATDGERLTRERDELDRARRQQEEAQTSFLAAQPKMP